MMKTMINYFIQRHLLANVIFFGVILLAVFAWNNIGKEEMPEFASNWIRVTTIYPGAPPEDVELFVTKPLEDELKGVVGIDELVTTSNVGVSSLRITLDDDYPNKEEVSREIKDAILRADLPSEVRDLPRVRQFKSSEKAILDIGFYHKGHKSLDQKARAELQKYVLSFENQLLSLREISSIDRSHYLKPELKIMVEPREKLRLQVSLSEIKDQVQANNIRVPVGSLQDKGESKVTALNELETVETLQDLILRGTYEGQGVRLGDVANVRAGFERSNSIFKVNGHEGVFLNIKKSPSTDILSAQAAVKGFVEKFNGANKDAPLGIIMMDDESYDVTNRLNIINTNGLLGFILIVLILFLFLDIKTGFWVAMGIPFCMGFTLIIAHMVGYTVNNMTLAGIIIVLGIVVDDAIIIAENISRHREEGMPLKEAAAIGTAEVVKPIFASIVTTCVAFIPLIFFEGFFGKLVAFIPLVVILMLLGSLIESLFVLPAHMSGKTPLLDRFARKEGDKSWFYKYEGIYERLLLKVFKVRIPLILFFVIFLIAAGAVFQSKMKFVMFPREESDELFIKVKAKPNVTREETARLIAPLEEIFVSDTENVVGVRTSVALSRRGGEVKENEASILVELIPADKREISLKNLLKKWEAFSETLTELDSVKFQKGRWGWGSGSAIELQIQENDDRIRKKVAVFLETKMKGMKDLVEVEIEEPLQKKEFIFNLKQDRLIKYNVAPATVTSALRTFVEGAILYSINKGDEEVDVRLSVPDSSKRNLKELLNLRLENKQGQLVFLRNIVDIEEVTKPASISRTNFKRTTMLYANLAEGSKITPLQIAERLEEAAFPEVASLYPTSILKFRGEIEDSREGQGEFRDSVIIVIALIYLILVVMFNSMTKPFIVLAIVPFGLAGVVFILTAHGMSIYGFFALIGALGMIGVVINDAIVMIDKIEKRIDKVDEDPWHSIARVASTRLRPVLVTTLTTVVGILPTAYGFAGYDSMLAEMMLTMGWGLAFGTFVTLLLVPCIYSFFGGKSRLS